MELKSKVMSVLSMGREVNWTQGIKYCVVSRSFFDSLLKTWLGVTLLSQFTLLLHGKKDTMMRECLPACVKVHKRPFPIY